MALSELLEKGSDCDLLRELIGRVAQRQMQMDAEGGVGAAQGEGGRGREVARTGARGISAIAHQEVSAAP